MDLDTLLAHCGENSCVPDGVISVDAAPAIHLSTSYLFRSSQGLLDVTLGDPGYVYRRYGNENTKNLGDAVALLENGREAICTSSGMGAISTSLIAAGILYGKKRVMGPFSCYGSTYSLLKSHFSHITECEFVDMGDTEVTFE
jgi:cystathionine beta-lyase/cystathionine gamma-synthase